mmetsp:Transcript_24856/g.36770  ORF Transcript_24856/g.36770 Transcript_24856/m.36770 type:complete len:145 (-) Transcript_24856:46-480(-)
MFNRSDSLLEKFPTRRRASSKDNIRVSTRYETSNSCSTDDSTSDSSFIDPIWAVSIVGSSEEFRILQEELRKSKMVTTAGAMHLMKTKIEKQGRDFERKQNQDPELRKVKKLEKKHSKRKLKKGLKHEFGQGLQNFKVFLTASS